MKKAAGGVGITLTKANHVFHFDRWWNPAVEDQTADRAFRIGQKKNVFVHKFISIGTLEERIDGMIEDKKKLSSTIIGADESWLTKLDNNAFKKLIALNKEAILGSIMAKFSRTWWASHTRFSMDEDNRVYILKSRFHLQAYDE